MPTIAPLKDNWWRPDLTKDEIYERVRSEDNYTNAKGYPLIKKVTKVKNEKHN
jgi:hypothetical protein